LGDHDRLSEGLRRNSRRLETSVHCDAGPSGGKDRVELNKIVAVMGILKKKKENWKRVPRIVGGSLVYQK